MTQPNACSLKILCIEEEVTVPVTAQEQFRYEAVNQTEVIKIWRENMIPRSFADGMERQHKTQEAGDRIVEVCANLKTFC